MTTFQKVTGAIAAVLLAILMAIGLFAYTQQIKIVNVADWNAGTRELRLAATMPQCSCLTLSARKERSSAGKVADLISRLTTGHLAKEKTPDLDHLALVVRRRGVVGADKVRVLSSLQNQWIFAFDWAGAELGEYYALQGYETEAKDNTHIKEGSAPVDLSAIFDMNATEPRSCQTITCPFDDLEMDAALGTNIGQNEIETAFTGVRIGRANRVIEAQATGKYRGAPGDCGCMLLQIISAPVRLTASLNASQLGDLTFTEKDTLVAIPFDYATTRGSDFYVISASAIQDSVASNDVNLGGKIARSYTDRPITNYVRLVGQLDGMECRDDAAVYTIGSMNSGTTQLEVTNQPSTNASISSGTKQPSGQPVQPGTTPLPPVVTPERLPPCTYQEGVSSGHVEGHMNLVGNAPKVHKTTTTSAAGLPSQAQPGASTPGKQGQ
jgi:hypothetical protein